MAFVAYSPRAATITAALIIERHVILRFCYAACLTQPDFAGFSYIISGANILQLSVLISYLY